VGKSGFAHFFEHMMFQGSKHVGDQEHMRIINEAGGDMNGTTNKDRTNYYETVPANQLEKVLWLEADRMGFLLDAVSQKKFEIQRATVKNERAQRIDNQPYGLVGEKVGRRSIRVPTLLLATHRLCGGSRPGRRQRPQAVLPALVWSQQRDPDPGRRL
jgi:predicted Zn-dependent peptidase